MTRSFLRVASFSGRGPYEPAPRIVKPDVVIPGVDILAAWTGANSPTKMAVDPQRVEFNVVSDTSMSCPHVSGVATLLKAARAGWTPAYTADSVGEGIRDTANGEAAGQFELGVGHVDPNRALDPRLVYDTGEEDYLLEI
jgi:subtilisin family serine protease